MKTHLIHALERARDNIQKKGSIWEKAIMRDQSGDPYIEYDEFGILRYRYGWRTIFDKTKVKARINELDETIAKLKYSEAA